MRRYTVTYLDSAIENLASIWENADDRSPISNSADTADRLLAAAPEAHSDHLGEGLWRLEILPLRFYFTIRNQDRLVEVSDVLLLGQEP